MHTKCPESDGLISALSLLFVEAATLYSSSSSEKSGPDFPRFYFTSPSDRNGNSRGVGQLLVSLVPDVDQLSESREAFFIFFTIQKAPINVDNSHGKVFEFRCYWKKYKK